MKEFTELADLAAARLGGTALAANDEFFAEKENLLKPEKPIFIPDKYTERGKWMDGWESRRRRTPGHDWCIIRLGIAGVIRGVVIDTAFFTGNFPSHCSIDACTADDLATADGWREILPKSALRGDSINPFAIDARERFTHVRLNIYPDGGVARLRVHGEPVPDWSAILAAGDVVNVSAVEHGGRAIDCSDKFYSHPQNLLMPYRAANMGDGWETKRRRGPGHDWAILRLGIEAVIRRVEVDTTHFKGNYPESCSLEAVVAAADPDGSAPWEEVVPGVMLGPHAKHVFESELRHGVVASHVRLNMFPDGGISRLRVFGTPTQQGRLAAGVAALNAMSAERARASLTNCCGSSAWVEQMAAARPFGTADLFNAADRVWNSLPEDDWREAFAHHPRIGERGRAAAQSAEAHRWSAGEQSQAQEAAPETFAALAEGNRAYEERFGYVFLVCATGRTSEEILDALRRRLANDPATELREAAAEQAKITRLRLEKLLTE
jgi:allantoicase